MKVCLEPLPSPYPRPLSTRFRRTLAGLFLLVVGVASFIAAYFATLPTKAGAAEPRKSAAAPKPAELQWLRDAEALHKKYPKVYPPHISTDKTVKLDYPIVYVRAPRHGDKKRVPWGEAFNTSALATPGGDLMLLHPDMSEELLVAGGNGAVADPMPSFDGEWVYYSLMHDQRPENRGPWIYLSKAGADIYKIHVKTKKIVQLTRQGFTSNTGVADRSPPYGVFNMGPCPLPGGKLMFTSNRNGFRPHRGYTAIVTQLFVMNDDGSNVELIAPMNLGAALHPVVLKDGRVMFASFETQGLRDLRAWSIWTIHPDGTNWAPLVSDFIAEMLYHFQTQLSDGRIVVEEYYNLNNQGFGTLFKLASDAPQGQPYFGPGYLKDPRNRVAKGQVNYNGPFSFKPYEMTCLTPFATPFDRPADLSDRKDNNSPRVGKFTHPSGAPDNHLLTVWSPGAAHVGSALPSVANPTMIDTGIYLIKSGNGIDHPGQMLLIKNDPNYNEHWPRALVPYKRIYGIDEPKQLPRLKNDGKLSPHLPEGTPFGLIGTSSFYKRESYPNGVVPKGKVTSIFAGGNNLFRGLGGIYAGSGTGNWNTVGADAGHYTNSDLTAVRILAMEPRTDPASSTKGADRFFNAGLERMRIIAEVPVRKFKDGKQPLDPDRNQDTSVLIKIPADVPFTFQTIGKHGEVLNMSQTWHQLRPGEIRTDCGGCHAHSQKPTEFRLTAAAKPDYSVWDATDRIPLLVNKARDESGKQWDVKDETGVRFVKGAQDVEFFHDIKPILDRSCVACHTQKMEKPAGNLVLDDNQLAAPEGNSGIHGKVPGTYLRLANDNRGRFGTKPLRQLAQPSRYVRWFESRRSLLVWKVFGKRMDSWSNDDFAYETTPGDPKTFQWKGKPMTATKENLVRFANLPYTGGIMPPPEAVAGTYELNGKKIKVEPLTDEDRRTLVRWIDLGCPIDLDYDQARPVRRSPGVGRGTFLHDWRPTLTVAYPQPDANESLSRILVGMYDYYTGLDPKSFTVVADFAVDGAPAGRNLAPKFKALEGWRWELKLNKPITHLKKGKLIVSIKDRQGNVTRIERTFSVGGGEAARR